MREGSLALPEEHGAGFRRVRVAAISMKPQKWCKDRNAARLESYFRSAAKKGAELAVAPEGVLEGYVVMDVIRNPARAPEMAGIAEPLRGRMVGRFRTLARELGICLAFGFAEKVGDGVYNTALFIDQRGRTCGVHRKTQLSEGYHDSWYFNRLGRRLRAFDTPFGRAGFMICNERWNPQIARALVLDGARFLMIPSFGHRAKDQDAAVTARARENGVPIVEANVGLNLIISKGEVVARRCEENRLTVATVDIPAAPSRRAAGALERAYLKLASERMAERLHGTLQRHGRACLSPLRPHV